MKKVLSIFLIISIIAMSFTGCGSKAGSYDVQVEGSIFGGAGDAAVDAELKFSPEWLTKGNNTKYSKDIASFAALLSADVYFREKDLEKGTQNRVLINGQNPDEYTWTTMLSSLGFTDVRHIESYKEKEYDSDQNDSVTMNMGFIQSGDYDVYVVAIRGCFSSGEWVSAFDIGADTAEYGGYTGEHPEWVNRSALKGLDVAASRAMQFINAFISEHEDAARKSCVLVTGHSRGASIAQIVGAYLEKADAIKSFTYTFNSMPCTGDASVEGYTSIFNVVDESDFFGSLFNFADEPLYRYGKTLCGCSDSGALSSELIGEYSGLFAKRFSNRTSLYESKTITELFDDGESAAARAEELNGLIGSEAGLGLEPLCSTSMSGNFSVDVAYCDAAQIQCIGKVLTYGTAAADAAKTIFESDEDFCAIIDFITEHSAEISAGHLLVNTYQLSKTVK